MNIYTIYRATNLITNKVYIGFDSHWPKRITSHKRNAKNGSKFLFYNAIRKHGWANFKWDVLYQSYDRYHCLKEMEPHFILEHESYGKGYNMTEGGEGGSSWRGIKTPAELLSIDNRIQYILASRSDEEKDASTNKRLCSLAARSDVEKEASAKKTSTTLMSKSDEEKANMSNKHKHTKSLRSDEEKAVSAKKTSNTLTNKSDEEKLLIAQKKRDTHSARSNEEKETTLNKIKRAKDIRSDKEKEASAKKRASSFAARTNKEKAVSAKKMSNTLAARSDEEKIATKILRQANQKLKVVCCVYTRKEYNSIWASRLGFIVYK